MSDAVAISICDAVDRAYPGLLSEAASNLEVFSVSGSLDALFVQLENSNVITSESLQKLIDNDKYPYQGYMINSPSMCLYNMGNKQFMGTTTKMPMSARNPIYDVFNGVGGYSNNKAVNVDADIAAQYWVSWAPIDADLCITTRSTETSYTDKYRNLVRYNNVDALPMSDDVMKSVYALCDNMKTKPAIAVVTSTASQHGNSEVHSNVSAAFAGYQETMTEGSRSRMLEEMPFTHMPPIPGYSRVLTTCTYAYAYQGRTRYIGFYIPGRCDRDIYYGTVCGYTSHHKYHTFNFVSGNQYATNEDVLYPQCRLVVYPEYAGVIKMSTADLDRACKNDLYSYRPDSQGGTLLFGPPNVDLQIAGSVETVVIDVPRTDRTVRIAMHYFTSDEYQWRVPIDWYKTYYNSGYGVFTPRVSNIRGNVLKEWEKLEYDTVTIRRLTNPLQFTYASVKDLPEAKQYKKMREKACKTDNFLEQVAIAGTSVKWSEVAKLDERTRSRVLWMNTSNSIVAGATAGYSPPTKSIVYTKGANGYITRTENGEVITIDATLEMHQEIVLMDKYFTKGVTLTSPLIWNDIISVTEDEDEILSDPIPTYSDKPHYSVSKGYAGGFADWIDPSGLADVTKLSPEQQYRLHIKNATEFDKMSSPLHKVLSSFGFDTLVMFLKRV